MYLSNSVVEMAKMLKDW